MVAVESQLMGVPCFASTNVPTDVDIGICQFLDLAKGAKYWAEKIRGFGYQTAAIDVQKSKEFMIETLINKLETIYNG